MSKCNIDLFAFCFMLLRDGYFEDIAISGGTFCRSIKSFSTANDVNDFTSNNGYCELLFRRNKALKFTERISLFSIIGFKLNKKSVSFQLSTSESRKIIRF